MDSVHLEQLPTYEGSRNDRVAPAPDEPPREEVAEIAVPTTNQARSTSNISNLRWRNRRGMKRRSREAYRKSWIGD